MLSEREEQSNAHSLLARLRKKVALAGKSAATGADETIHKPDTLQASEISASFCQPFVRLSRWRAIWLRGAPDALTCARR